MVVAPGCKSIEEAVDLFGRVEANVGIADLSDLIRSLN
jgi:hypothetical protein